MTKNPESFKDSAGQIIKRIEEEKEAKELRRHIRSNAVLIMFDYGNREGGRWITTLERPLSDVMLVRLDLESFGEHEDEDSPRNFTLRFDFQSQRTSWSGNATAEISDEGINNFQGEKANLMDLKQIKSCLDFIRTQKEIEIANSVEQPIRA